MLQVVNSAGAKKLDPISFDDFWLLYSRKEARKDALKAWGTLSETDQLVALVAACEWRRIWAAQGRGSQHTPLAGSWLRGERYDDEIPAEFSRSTHASQKAFVPGEKFERGEIPEHVKAQLAKLRR